MPSPLTRAICISLLLMQSHFVATQASSDGTAAVAAASNSKRAATTPKNDSSGVEDILRDTFQLLDSLDEKLTQVDNKTASDTSNRELRSFEDIERSSLAKSPASETKEESKSLAVPNLFSKISSQHQAANTKRRLEDDEQLRQLAEQFSSVRKSAAAVNEAKDGQETLATAASNAHEHQVFSSLINPPTLSGDKRVSRQLAAGVEEPTTSGQHTGLGRFDNNFTEKHIKFSLDLMQAIFASQSYTSKSSSLDSFLISPVSIQLVLMMMHLGARGQTKRELSNSLHFLNASPVSGNSSSSSSASSVDLLSSSNGTTSGAANKNSKLWRRNPQQKVQNAAPATSKPANNQQVLNNNVHEQFGAALRQLLKDPSVARALACANQIFVQKDLPLSSQYEWAVKHYYGADLKQVDFQNQAEPNKVANQSGTSTNSSTSSTSSSVSVQQMINDWVDRQTRGKLSNFLSSPVPTSTLLMALNVLFYKGDWQYKFDPGETEPEAWFTRTDGKTARVAMMTSKLPLAHAHDPIMKTSVIELPYKAQRLGLFILLPDEVDGIFDTIHMLNSTSFANLISMMRKSAPSSPTDPHGLSGSGIHVRLPKFSIESSPRLSQILSQQLGLKTLFSPDVADLSGMFAAGQTQSAALQKRSSAPLNQTSPTGESHTATSQPPPPQVGLDELLHKAVLQVHEQGSVAAAATATVVERVGLFNAQYFEADHPFLVFLMDKQTGLVLFSGVYAGPAGSETGNNLKSYHQSSAASSSANNSSAPANQSDGGGGGGSGGGRHSMTVRNSKVSA